MQSSMVCGAAVALVALLALAHALPPFEIRSPAGAERTEGAEQWLRHLQKNRVCHTSNMRQPSLLCSSTKFEREPECVHIADLCDGKADCPQGEDEEQFLCMALRTSRSQNQNTAWRR